jgi:hypothetical protein
MFLGHFALAFAAKKVAPKTSLGTLVFAAQFADMLWPILLLTGLEQVRIVPGLLPASPFDFSSYPISHTWLPSLDGEGFWVSFILPSGAMAGARCSSEVLCRRTGYSISSRIGRTCRFIPAARSMDSECGIPFR